MAVDTSFFAVLIDHLEASQRRHFARLLRQFVNIRENAKDVWADRETHFDGRLDTALVTLSRARACLTALCPTLPEPWVRLPHLGIVPKKESTPEEAKESITDEAAEQLRAFCEFVTSLSQPKKHRRKGERRTIPLTAAQAEAAQLVGEHKGNFTAAGRAAGKTRQAMKKLYDKAMRKLGQTVVRPKKPKTQALPTDRRGQVDVAAPIEEDK
jgi:hypothetical protein